MYVYLTKLGCRLGRSAACFTARYYRHAPGIYGYRSLEPRIETSGSSTYTDYLSLQLKASALSSVDELLAIFRSYGHFAAHTNPLVSQEAWNSQNKEAFDKIRHVLPMEGNYERFGAKSAEDFINKLKEMYCCKIGYEFMHCLTADERQFFIERIETDRTHVFNQQQEFRFASLMLQCEAFDHFVGLKFPTLKRYGGEGAEGMIVFIDELLRLSCDNDISHIIMCMPHRGRINLLATLLQLPLEIIFRKMKGLAEFSTTYRFLGDVLSHLYQSLDIPYGKKSVHVSLIPNPSHLEANNPVAMGKTRSVMQRLGCSDYALFDKDATRTGNQALCFQIHGDASMAGQGIVTESFCLSNVPHFRIGGSIHLIVNNQIGYTTEPYQSRSSPYSSDVGKIVSCPILHVNGECAHSIARACALALAYRQHFNRDIIVDLICYRQWGHNEMDQPAFTQPKMYKKIRSRQSIPQQFAQYLHAKASAASDSVDLKAELKASVEKFQNKMNEALAASDNYVIAERQFKNAWASMKQARKGVIHCIDTGCHLDLLKYIGLKSVELPTGFVPHGTLQKSHILKRHQMLETGENLDWACAEALAIGSLLHDGFDVRISGQDVGRGTFSQRHWMLVDQNTDEAHVVLNNLQKHPATTVSAKISSRPVSVEVEASDRPGHLEVANSPLSELAVMGFEYGMSIDTPRRLCIWEAQFGDFFNGAQIILDTFLASGEQKWLLQSGLVLLLPHGMDGAGPEHSQCRQERFLLQSDAEEDKLDSDIVNWQIVNPTTPVQYFHLLRAQMLRPFRQPLVVIAPKILLRHPQCVSRLTEFTPSGAGFRPVLPDETIADPASVQRVVFCSGKHYFTLAQERAKRGISNMALVRLERLCPFPAKELSDQLAKFGRATQFLWSQEEHRNSGPWPFVQSRFRNLFGCNLQYAGRGVLAAPAVGVGQMHKLEEQYVLDHTFGP